MIVPGVMDGCVCRLQTHPQLKLILYISGSGGLLERMAACQPDIMSIDQHVDMRDAIARIGPDFAVQVRLIPSYLFSV